MGGMEIGLDEKDLVEIDLVSLKEVYRRNELSSIPLDQLCKVHKVYLNPTTEATSRSSEGLGILQNPTKDPHKTPKEDK
jgi:hypothetical protein